MTTQIAFQRRRKPAMVVVRFFLFRRNKETRFSQVVFPLRAVASFDLRKPFFYGTTAAGLPPNNLSVNGHRPGIHVNFHFCFFNVKGR
jgi:hypothetical protein